MRLYNDNLSKSDADRIATFDKWLLQIGNGSDYDNADMELIKIPPDLCGNPCEDPMKSIVQAIYPSLLKNYNDPAYLTERAILTPKNEVVHDLNDMIMNVIPGESRTYLSSDSICKASMKTDQNELLYPAEFLNSLKFNGVPNHDIQLKEGTPIMLLRNLNQSEGLCNGTRLIITRLGKWSIRADIISGTNIGQNVTIPRIIMSPNESRVTSREGLTIINADDEMEDKTFVKNIVYREVFEYISPSNSMAQKSDNLQDDITHDHAIRKLMVIDDEERDKIDGKNLEDYPGGNASLRKKKRKAIILDDEDDCELGGKEN
ncbi:ATP-dependent DNA helicase [Heracleum sosnowskyi]|uniref:ATP-dependent DNA helicase n=1 Tax=Heracleum sosnowskyi TaxID=360622 RepID=A0AAD8M5X4_9APIA|nr:ATP-dependent DNA helicase [Heracleum sosnowskyi]